jgi:hypothetical protein
MATFTDPHAFAAHVAKYGDRIQNAQSTATKAAAETAGIAIRQAGSKFGIRGRTGKKWSLGATVEGPYSLGSNSIAYVTADPMGFWVLVEKGARPHEIRPRKVGWRARKNAAARGDSLSTRKALLVPGVGGGYFAKVNHPGTGPIGHPWKAGVTVAKRTAPLAFERALIPLAFGRAA